MLYFSSRLFLPAATQAATGVTHPDSSLEALLAVLLLGDLLVDRLVLWLMERADS
jgi:hypothetical protein